MWGRAVRYLAAAPLPCAVGVAGGAGWKKGRPASTDSTDSTDSTGSCPNAKVGHHQVSILSAILPGFAAPIARCASAPEAAPQVPKPRPTPKRFDGKVFLVTGASSGIGEVIAKLLAQDGAHVVLTARRSDRLATVKEEIVRQGGSVSVKTMDVLDADAVEQVVQSIVREHGKLDGAFNNAGGGVPARVTGDVQQFKKGFDTNFYGCYHCMRAELVVMMQQGHGAIVNNASIYASLMCAGAGNYCIAKHALLALQECAALESAASGVRVNSVSPGFTRPSESLDAVLQQSPEVEKLLLAPLVPHGGGLLQAETDVYPAVAFLLDEASGTITGIDIPVAGGHSIPTLDPLGLS